MRRRGRTGAFIFVSCSELQTQHRHAAADATAPRRPDTFLLASKLELASGGTVFLDAVHELSTELQRSLYEMMVSDEPARSGS